MEANLLPGAQPSDATLRHPRYDEADKQPSADAPDDGTHGAEPGSFEPLNRLTHRAASLIIVAGVASAQLVWIAVLVYAVYWIGARLPL